MKREMKIALAQINPIIGDLSYNCAKILNYIEQAKAKGAEIVIFPEMALLGYMPEDLLLSPTLMDRVEKELESIRKASDGIAVIVGTVRRNPDGKEKPFYNSAAIFDEQVLVGYQDKRLLPDYDVFSERRYFEPGKKSTSWRVRGLRCGLTICEDLWQHLQEALPYSDYQCDPIWDLKAFDLDLLINISASPFSLGKERVRRKLAQAAQKELQVPFIFCNQIAGHDGLLFDGNSFVINSKGEFIAKGTHCQEELLFVDLNARALTAEPQREMAEELFDALVMGISDYMKKLHFKRVCIGLSGGIDSAVVAVLAVKALGPDAVLALNLPSRFSSKEAKEDAHRLAKQLGIELRELSIEPSLESLEATLQPHLGDFSELTFENLQARLRSVLLMAFANQRDCLLLNTSNKSESAMGYTTLYGDLCGALCVLGDVVKGHVYTLAEWINRERELIPHSIIDRPPSAELRMNQKDSDTLPPYPIVDCIVQEYIENMKSPEAIARDNNLSLELVSDLIERIHRSEYKRHQAPPALRVTKRALRLGRRIPIVSKIM